MAAKPLQFSYSLLSQDDNCPEAARQLFIIKKYKKSYTVQGGIDDHKVLEARLRYQEPLPAPLAKAEPLVASLERNGTPEVEVSLAVNRDLSPTGFWDGWLRGKYDVITRAVKSAFIGDWKSGKVRESQDQLEIGALLLMATHPQIDTVVGANIWLGLQTPKLGTPFTFKRAENEQRWLKWVRRIQTIERRDPNVEWEKRSGPLCKFCPVQSCLYYKGG